LSDSAAIAHIEDTFSFLESWEERYRYLIDIGRRLPPFDENLKTEDKIVQGCVSRVWLHHHCEGKNFIFEVDSDSAIVKGLAAVLLALYSGHDADYIKVTEVEPLFDRLGLRDHLTPSRSNGFFSMAKKIKQIALG
jgi:cysteine desulfuration protein SufE